ncbi:MAG: protein kinase [Anaerolineales bacterium]|nr:protein kinase [Anaerolineales bacterium]
MAATHIGKTIGKYQIVEHLGRGGMAEVYKAYQPALDRYVAIKLMHSFLSDDPDFLGRFQREARAVASLRHPNIVQVYDFDVADGIYYMVMEFIDGVTLKAKLQEMAARNEKVPLEEAIRISYSVASALAYAHKRDMVHRDIKPANVMMNRENQVILTDFGIAKILSGPQYTASGAMIGTPAYMSPEQGLGKPGDARSDIYSLGTMLFQMATGQLPYDADTPLAVVLKHVNDPMPIPSKLNPALPPDIERVILKAMAKNPDDRYQTAAQFMHHLEQIQAGQSIGETITPKTIADSRQAVEPMATMVAPPPTMAKPRPRPQKGKPKWILPAVAAGVILAILAVVAVAAALSSIKRNRDATPEPTLVVAAATVETQTNETKEPSSTNTPEPTSTPLDLIGAASTALAQQNATLTAQAPTNTPEPTPSSIPTMTPTPECVLGYELVDYYTYGNPNNYNSASDQTSAPTDASFELLIRISNKSECSWPAGVTLILLDGDSLGSDESVKYDSETPIDGTAEFALSMQSGGTAGIKTSSWKLQSATDEPIGDPFDININVYPPASPTPVRPAATAIPVQPSPTTPAEATGPIEFNYFIHDCEYAGSDWRCWMTLTPYNGVGQPYTFFVFDSDQPARYYGGNAEHMIQARRCKPWVHEIKLQDEGGNTITKNLYISPDDYFAGGCTE